MSKGVLAELARYGLPDARPLELSAPLAPGDWQLLRTQIRSSGLAGLAAAALGSDDLPATDSQVAEIRDDHVRTMGNALQLERALLESEALLRSVGIEVRVLKGSALAHTVYENPSLRCFQDLDLLVPARRYDGAVEVLAAAGGEVRFDEPHEGFTGRFGKGVCIVTGFGLEIDVHRTFVSGPFGLTVDVGSLFEAGTPFELAGRTLLGLPPPEQFLQVCFHAALGNVPPRWMALRDVAQILLCTDLDVDRVQRLAQEWRARAVVARAVNETWSRLGLDSPHPLASWASRYEPSRWEQRALSAYIGPRRSYAAQAVAGLSGVPGVMGKLTYLRWILLPDRRYLEQRDGSYWRRLGRGTRLVVGSWRTR